MPNSTGNGTKSLRTNIWNATHQATPASTARIPIAEVGGTDMVTNIKYSTLAEVMAGLNIADGLYLPVASALVNLDAATPNALTRYMRIGSRVIVTGTITLDPTAAALTTVDLTLPIASVFATVNDAGGVINGTVTNFGQITSVIAGGVRISFTAVSTASGIYGFTFGYTII